MFPTAAKMLRGACIMTVSEIIRTAAQASKAWPYEEARKLLKRYQNGAPEKGHVLFETGYGPSGLPHIGTFNEVLRTTMVRNAYHALSDIPTRLIAFSDDMAGQIGRAHVRTPVTTAQLV